MVETRDVEVCHRVQNESNNHLPRRTIVRFAKRRFAEDLLSNRNINLTLVFNKLGFPSSTQISLND